jgi:hypothetical protein
MKKLPVLSVVALILMLSTIFFLSVDATTPVNIDPGDTFLYTVDTWDVPWEELIPPTEVPFDLANFVCDLSGSTVGVKIMDTYANGDYVLDFYLILGNKIEIPLPDDTSVILEKGAGMGLGSFPGSDMLELIAGTRDEFGLPFYLNPGEWSAYQTELEALESAETTVTITNTDGSDFEFFISVQTGDGVDLLLSATWYREGEYAGVVKSISGSADGDLTGDGVSNHIDFALTFDKREQRILPNAIRNLDDMVLSLTTSEFAHSVSGFSTSTHDQIDDILVYSGDLVTDLEGLPFMKFDIEDVAGCYYNSRIELYNPETEFMEELVGELWWNGFTGFPVINTDNFIFSDLPYTFLASTIALVPLLAPGITPDWDMWKASTNSISEVNEVVEKVIEDFFKGEEALDLGLDLKTLDSVYQLRESGDTLFFYSELELGLDWDGGEIETPLEGIKTTTSLSIDVSSNFWVAYTKEGLLAGAGVEVLAYVSATDIPAEGGAFETGVISFDVTILLQSDLVSAIPNPEVADPIAGFNVSDITTTPTGDTTTEETTIKETDLRISPGFEMLSPILVMTTIVVIIKRKKLG